MSSIFPVNGFYYYKGFNQKFSLKTRDRKVAKKLQREYDRQFALKAVRGEEPVAPNNITFAAAKEEYLKYKQQKFAHRTYKTDKQRLDWVYNHTGNLLLKNITLDTIMDYVEYRKQKVSASTIRITLIVLKAFLNYCRKRSYITSNPFDMYPIDKGVCKTDFLSLKQIEKLKAYSDPERPYLNSLINFALATGLRRGELASLRWDKINEHTMIVQGKTGTREFPITPKVRVILDSMVKCSEWVFPSPYDHSEPINSDTLSKLFRKVFRALKMPESFTLHTIRHTYASHLAMQGVPLQKIGVLLGHKQFETTLIYAHLQPKDLNDIEPEY